MKGSRRDRRAWRLAGLGAVAGLLAAGAALGVGQLVAGLTGASGSPVVAVGQLQIDFTPPWLKNFAINEFGSDDKLVLVTGILVVLAIFAAIIGAAATRRLAYGMAGLAVFGIVGLTAAATRPTATLASVLPTLAATAAAVVVLRLLVSRASLAAGPGPDTWAGPGPSTWQDAWQDARHAGPDELADSGPETAVVRADPEVPGTPGAADAAAAQDVPGVMEASSAREIPDATEAPAAPEVPAFKEVPPVPDVPMVPDLPVGRGRPGAPGAVIRPAALEGADGAERPEVLAGSSAASGPSGLSGPWRPSGPSRSSGPSGPRRRSFLAASAATAGVAAVAGLGGRLLAERSSVSSARQALRLPKPSESAPPLPAGVNLDIPGLTPFITSNTDFYRVDTAIVLPQVAPSAWQLRIHGMVAREITITFDELLRRPLIEDYITLCCVSNPVGGPYISNALWLGASLASVLREAGIRAGADQLMCTSVDGFTSGTPVQTVMDGRDALLAVAMNGQPLPVAHGFPVRMVVPGLYGYVSATKWLTDINVTTFAGNYSYWAQRGWSQQAPIKTESRIDVPTGQNQLPVGHTAVAGVAWAQHTGIEAVEVRVDQGPWNQARLAAVPGLDTWRQWVWEWDATRGNHVLEARATDKIGYTQTAVQEPPEPNGATGYPSVTVTVA
jgi:DMSO/TMAO reductase YedYZ molybdopterin-dependent catalytic subunit